MLTLKQKSFREYFGDLDIEDSNENRVELRPAFVWTCDSCGEDNYISAMIIEESPEEFEERKAEAGIIGNMTGYRYASPEKVWCEICFTGFESE